MIIACVTGSAIVIISVWIAASVQHLRLYRLFTGKYPEIAQRLVPFAFSNTAHPEKIIFFFRKESRAILKKDPTLWKYRQRLKLLLILSVLLPVLVVGVFALYGLYENLHLNGKSADKVPVNGVVISPLDCESHARKGLGSGPVHIIDNASLRSILPKASKMRVEYLAYEGINPICPIQAPWGGVQAKGLENNDDGAPSDFVAQVAQSSSNLSVPHEQSSRANRRKRAESRLPACVVSPLTQTACLTSSYYLALMRAGGEGWVV